MQSDHHTEAHSVLYVLPTQTKDIHELLDIGHASRKPANRQILLTILQNVKFLARRVSPTEGMEQRITATLCKLFCSEQRIMSEFMNG